MEFRPCIDIHNGCVKQIVGSSLSDKGDFASENFVSANDAAFYAKMYREDGLKGGHIILLNPIGSDFYKADCKQASLAFSAYPNAMQIGGGITSDNAQSFLDMGASHCIVTSYVFKDGKINMENLKRLCDTIGKEKIVLDLSCRRRDGDYYIVTDRWQRFTDEKFNFEMLNTLSEYCDEFLVHAVDIEGKSSGIEGEVATILSQFDKVPCTYAGGISSIEDIKLLEALSDGKLNFTVGSALDLFGGKLPYKMLASVYSSLRK